MQLFLGCRAHIQKIFHRLCPDNLPVVVPGDFGDGIRLFVVRPELCENLVPADADADGDPKLTFDALPDFFGDTHAIAFDLSAGCHIEPGFVQPKCLLQVCIVCVDLVGQLGEPQIDVHSGRHNLKVGAAFTGLPQGHAGFDTGLLCQLILCQNDSMPGFRITAHSQRLPSELRVVEKLNAGIAGIHVAVQYGSLAAHVDAPPFVWTVIAL